MNIAKELVVVAKDLLGGDNVTYRMSYSEWKVHTHENHPNWAAMERHLGQKCREMADDAGKECHLLSPDGKVQEVIEPQHRMAKEVVAWEGRMNFPRSFYIPKNAPGLKQLDEGKDVGLEFWSYEDGRGGVYGLAFGGKANKPLWHYRFRNQEKFEEQVRLTISDRKSHAERIEKQKQERTQFKHTLKEGDIMYSSWGYDQTNIDFYQVVAVGEKSVKIRKIGQKTVGSATTSEEVVADPNHFVGPPMTKVVRPGDVVSIASYASAYKWDGKPKYQTAFGFGH